MKLITIINLNTYNKLRQERQVLTFYQFIEINLLQKAPKAQRPQSFNYAPQVVEKRKPVYAPTQAPPQYYDYEEEVPATQRPVQLARPKYSAPKQQFAPQQQQPQRQQQQFGADAGIVYAPEPRAPAQQYQQFENRQPVQFPSENASPAPQLNSRSEQFSLFSPASQRADTFKSKVRSRKLLTRIKKRRKKSKKIVYIVKRKRSYYDK